MASYLSYELNCIPTSGKDIRARLMIEARTDFYLVHNGHIVKDTDIMCEGQVHVFLRVLGGKGGFGSMLRAIGAQIEKTTNREACRDLSGRRLRDINEEQRLKNWIALQADREREVVERRKKRLERLCAEPKHEFKDKNYEKERSELTEKVSDAVEQGYKLSAAGGSGVGAKRKHVTSTVTKRSKKKKSLMWMDADEQDLSSSVESDESADDNSYPKKKTPSNSSEQTTSESDKPTSLPEDMNITGTSEEVHISQPSLEENTVVI